MTSLARGLQVMEAFATLGPGQNISTLVRHTGLPRGVVGRCLHTLGALGYIDRHDRHYSVKPRVLRLADAYLSDQSLSAVAQPLLERLRDEIGESCSLGVLDGGDVLYLARASRNRILSTALHVGSRLPAWRTSMGRVLLAALPPEERNAHIPDGERDGLETRLAQIAADGFALVDQELEPGLRSMAVPVLDRSGAVAAAINVGTNALERSTGSLLHDVLPRLRETSAVIAREMGWAFG